MRATWNTKQGSRRVRYDPPTLAEAVAAAQGLTDDFDAQVGIAAELMGVSADAVRAELRKHVGERRPQVILTTPGGGRGVGKGGLRSVVVERKASRRLAVRPPSSLSRGIPPDR